LAVLWVHFDHILLHIIRMRRSRKWWVSSQNSNGVFTPPTRMRQNCLVLSVIHRQFDKTVLSRLHSPIVFTPPTRTHRNWVETIETKLSYGRCEQAITR